MEEVRTRYAPSPTGFMHVGNLRSALYEYLIAKSNKGKFILRIEDTDQERKVDGAIDFIYNTLDLCGFKIDESPKHGGNYGSYLQSERLDLYKKYAEELVEKKAAYYCFCTEEVLGELREKAEKRKEAFIYNKKCLDLSEEEIKSKIDAGEKFVIRQNVSHSGVTSYIDGVYGKIEVENKFIEDQVLLKSDGYPTYNFANVVDDYSMKINVVVRGNEYLSSTPKYNLLYDAFGWEKPNYIHLPHVNGSDGKKLSKRNGDSSFMDLYNDGYLPEAIINYLALLGWSSKDNKEIFSMDELIENFDVKRINKSGAIFDLDKLAWINHQYLQKISDDKLLEITRIHLEETYDLSKKSEQWIKALIKLYQKEIRYGKEIVSVCSLFFKDNLITNDECTNFMTEEGITETIDVFKEEIESIDVWNVENINNAINKTKEKSGAKGKMLYMPLRIKVSGQMHGPELPSTIYLLGKEVIIKRLSC